MNPPDGNDNNTTRESTTNNERTLDPVNQVSSTGAGSSLADFGNNASAMAGESITEIKNKVSSISPGEVVDNVRGKIQSTCSGGNGNDNGGEAETLEREGLPDHEELKHIDNMEREKIMEFLQERQRSSANVRPGK